MDVILFHWPSRCTMAWFFGSGTQALMCRRYLLPATGASLSRTARTTRGAIPAYRNDANFAPSWRPQGGHVAGFQGVDEGNITLGAAGLDTPCGAGCCAEGRRVPRSFDVTVCTLTDRVGRMSADAGPSSLSRGKCSKWPALGARILQNSVQLNSPAKSNGRWFAQFQGGPGP